MTKLFRQYDIIYADPPWPEGKSGYKIAYRDKSKRVSVREDLNAHRHFPTMSIESIMALDVQVICKPDACLFLWSTARHLPMAFMTLEQWGFRYVNMAFVWVKCNAKKRNPVFGTGRYTKQNAEFVLFGIRGKPLPVNDFKINQIIYEPRTRVFQKPISVRQRIECLFGNTIRAELFARDKWMGWDVWGNEVSCDIDLGYRPAEPTN